LESGVFTNWEALCPVASGDLEVDEVLQLGGVEVQLEAGFLPPAFIASLDEVPCRLALQVRIGIRQTCCRRERHHGDRDVPQAQGHEVRSPEARPQAEADPGVRARAPEAGYLPGEGVVRVVGVGLAGPHEEDEVVAELPLAPGEDLRDVAGVVRVVQEVAAHVELPAHGAAGELPAPHAALEAQLELTEERLEGVVVDPDGREHPGRVHPLRGVQGPLHVEARVVAGLPVQVHEEVGAADVRVDREVPRRDHGGLVLGGPAAADRDVQAGALVETALVLDADRGLTVLVAFREAGQRHLRDRVARAVLVALALVEGEDPGVALLVLQGDGALRGEGVVPVLPEAGGHRCALLRRGATGDEVDHGREGVGAVVHRLGTQGDLDPLDVVDEDRDLLPVDVPEARVRDPVAVHQDQDLVRVLPAGAEGRDLVGALVPAHHRESGDEVEGLGGVLGVERPQLLLGDDVEVRWRG
jgi:hypothetical protein